MKMKLTKYVNKHLKYGWGKNSKPCIISDLYGQAFFDWFDKEYGLAPIIVPKVL